VFDWWPEYTPPKKPKIGKLAEYRSGRVGDISDDWVGSHFPYVHFRLPDGDEGMAIDWGERHEETSNLTRLGEPAGQEVWLGDVEGFISANLESLDDWETYASYNGAYDGALLWALDGMGSLVQGRAPDWVIKSVKSDPGILWPDLIKKILSDPVSYPVELELAASKLWNEERRRLEKEQGQVYLWPGENDDG